MASQNFSFIGSGNGLSPHENFQKWKLLVKSGRNIQFVEIWLKKNVKNKEKGR